MEEEVDFIVVTRREGTFRTDRSCEDIINKMGNQSLSDRALGGVTIAVDQAGGKITKQKINWRDDSSDQFKENQKLNADALLAATVKLVTGSGDDGEIKIKVRAKL